MTRRYWRARHNIFDYYGVYHKAPPPQPEEVQEIARRGIRYSFRYLSNNQGERRLAADLPYCGGGLLMNQRAAKVLLPLIEPWTSIQQDVQVDGQPTHILAIVTQSYDAMNRAATIGHLHESGIWFDVKELYLNETSIGSSPIFRVPTAGLQWDPILSQEIADAIRVHELTGLNLCEAVVE